jgi:nucleolar complex protein 3
LDVLLEPDTSVGQGVFMPQVEDPEYCNAGNTALYELHILKVMLTNEGLFLN